VIGLYKKFSQEVTKRLNHPIFFAIFGLISCWSGINFLLHLGTGWQDILLNMLKAVSAFLFVVLMGLEIRRWFVKRGKDGEKARQ
jgi:low affinity Fe/Cu permease